MGDGIVRSQLTQLRKASAAASTSWRSSQRLAQAQMSASHARVDGECIAKRRHRSAQVAQLAQGQPQPRPGRRAAHVESERDTVGDDGLRAWPPARQASPRACCIVGVIRFEQAGMMERRAASA